MLENGSNQRCLASADLAGEDDESLATTNAIENMNATLRRILRNVKRWRGEGRIQRWVALGIAEAQRGFRRVKGYWKMPVLVAALRPNAPAVVEERKVA